ncbi:uncharacterized protein LOC105157988 [Sesamum indicum]|uniref:Uncharacterized protein LOC105157988 n=1 Tax=Sesamum indicum TaxID=4182 RepID=A0A6I9SYN3_SESIN|nr:uncharacterized protein LOC105157988 [Sesamum indicum]
MEGPCDICGDVGVADALVTCCQCKINCEHMYCMRTPLEEHIDDWHCEECESSSKAKSLASCPIGEFPSVSKSTNSVEAQKGGLLCGGSRKLLNQSRKGSVDWEKKVATGKTKYICVKEAIKLSAGEKKYLAPSNITCHSKPPGPRIGVNKLERTLSRPRTTPLCFSSEQDLASGGLAQSKPQRPGNMEIYEGQVQKSKKLSELQRSVGSFQPSRAPMNKHIQKELPTNVQLPQTKARSSMHKPLSAPSPSQNASLVTISGGNRLTAVELRTCNAENVNNNLLPDLEKRSVTPALDAVWKGSFRIHDDHRHRVLNPQIHAHPATRVRRKIHEFSKQMPKVLHFHLVPYKKFWINLFQDYIPDERDIGLYFFPGDSERYEDYAFLLDYISFRNLALRKQIADVELLVFPSRLLPANCQCWNGKRFLWGVFHRLKQDTSARLDNREIKLSVQPSSHNPKSDMEEVDMDIDMVGGINVGRIDVPVHERPLREKHIPSRQESLSASISGRAFDPVTMPPLNVVEPCPAIPPGFGEVFRLRVQDSSLSLVKNVEVHEGKSKEQDDHHSLYSSSAEVKSKNVCD